MELKSINKGQSYAAFEFLAKCNGDLKLLHISDVHFDNAKCKRNLLKKHLDRIVELNGYICIYGDLFCLMQGKYDPRSSKHSLIPEHTQGYYIDNVINDAVNFFKPYANRILLVSKGNHETSVSSRIESDILHTFVEKLNASGSQVYLGGYGGYYHITIGLKDGNKRTYTAGYHHGAWGGVISKGTQAVGRYATIYPSADVFFSGHTHDSWIVPQPRFILNTAGKRIDTENQWHIRTGTYKEEFEKQEGWAVEKLVMPKYLGGVIQSVNYRSATGSNLTHEFTII